MSFERGFLRKPAVRELLATWPPVVATGEKDGPHQCCADFAIVTEFDGETDRLWCGVCDRRWTRPCSVGDLIPAVEN